MSEDKNVEGEYSASIKSVTACTSDRGLSDPLDP